VVAFEIEDGRSIDMSAQRIVSERGLDRLGIGFGYRGAERKITDERVHNPGQQLGPMPRVFVVDHTGKLDRAICFALLLLLHGTERLRQGHALDPDYEKDREQDDLGTEAQAGQAYAQWTSP
jgi:hypothetical protein